MASVASFRATLFGVASQTGIVDFFCAVILAVTAFARIEIIVRSFDKTAVRADPIRGMRIARVAGFARNIRDAAVKLAAVTLPAFTGIELFLCQSRPVKTGRGRRRPAGFMHAYFFAHARGRRLRITARSQKQQQHSGNAK